MSATQYYNVLAKLWQGLDLFYEVDWSCSQDNKKYTKMLENERVSEFLAGLNKELDEFGYIARIRILNTCSMGWETHTNPNGDKKLLRRGEKIWCEYCHRPKHTKAAYWKLHGRHQIGRQINLVARDSI
ncbi:hypothetical protein Patl1_11101 [Pistacia atlantica]|uniref:Uncharacterized protein n=1 Tax=Pistacia atlantica TaxID=434234 RepID=A0ACC1A3W4_9ROSI|nr:hypothetical protein Patl1_11101 [Pistacia atlantica]